MPELVAKTPRQPFLDTGEVKKWVIFRSWSQTSTSQWLRHYQSFISGGSCGQHYHSNHSYGKVPKGRALLYQLYMLRWVRHVCPAEPLPLHTSAGGIHSKLGIQSVSWNMHGHSGSQKRALDMRRATDSKADAKSGLNWGDIALQHPTSSEWQVVAAIINSLQLIYSTSLLKDGRRGVWHPKRSNYSAGICRFIWMRYSWSLLSTRHALAFDTPQIRGLINLLRMKPGDIWSGSPRTLSRAYRFFTWMMIVIWNCAKVTVNMNRLLDLVGAPWCDFLCVSRITSIRKFIMIIRFSWTCYKNWLCYFHYILQVSLDNLW